MTKKYIVLLNDKNQSIAGGGWTPGEALMDAVGNLVKTQADLNFVTVSKELGKKIDEEGSTAENYAAAYATGGRVFIDRV